MQNNTVVAMDVETTGTEPGSRMIEIAAILFDENGIHDKFEGMVNPEMPLPEDAAKVNGITDEMLAGQPSAGEVLSRFFSWLPDNATLVAHYACFDTGIISWEATRFGIPVPEGLMVIDTCEIAKALKETKNNKLVTLAEHYKLDKVGDAHRAMCDTDLCRQYFLLSKQKNVPESPLLWDHAGHNYSYSVDFPPPLTILPDSVADGMPVVFMYKDAKDDITTRAITPYGWAMTPTGLMFHGFCHMREARRTFKADRVIEVITQTEPEVA